MNLIGNILRELRAGPGTELVEKLPRSDSRTLEAQVDQINTNERAVKAEKLRQRREAEALLLQQAEEKKLQEARVLAAKTGLQQKSFKPGQFAKFMETHPSHEQIEAYLNRRG